MKRRHFLMTGGAVVAATTLPGMGLAARLRKTRELRLTELYQRLMSRRLTQLRRLKAYGEDGVFPINATFMGARTPFFIDRVGTPCAVAHLMQKDGWESEVAEIARTNNYIQVMDVLEGPIADWVTESGLTQEEAATIQPGYWGEEDQRHFIAAEIKRLRAHFAALVPELHATTHAALPAALARLMETLPANPNTARGFVVVPPEDVATARLVNLSTHVLEVRVTPVTHVPGTTWTRAYRGNVLPVGDKRGWHFVEWACEKPVHSNALRLVKKGERMPANTQLLNNVGLTG